MSTMNTVLRSFLFLSIASLGAVACGGTDGEDAQQPDEGDDDPVASTSEALNVCGKICAVAGGAACADIPGGIAGAAFCAYAGAESCDWMCKHRAEPHRIPVARAERCLHDLLPGRHVSLAGTHGTFWTFHVTGGGAAVSFSNAGPRHVIVSWKLDGGRNVRPASPAPC